MAITQPWFSLMVAPRPGGFVKGQQQPRERLCEDVVQANCMSTVPTLSSLGVRGSCPLQSVCCSLPSGGHATRQTCTLLAILDAGKASTGDRRPNRFLASIEAREILRPTK